MAGACTTAPPRLPRRTETSPSVSRIRSASRSETRLTLNWSTSTSWRGNRSPSASSPSMIWRRNSSATISAILGADNRRRASGPIPRAVIRFLATYKGYKKIERTVGARELDWLSYFSSNGINSRVSRRGRSAGRHRSTDCGSSRSVTAWPAATAGSCWLDAGAQVRKIEPPQGDPLRRYSATDSPVPDGPNGQASPLFSYLNAGKSSLTCCAGFRALPRRTRRLPTSWS